jgi:hypothetical protein
MPRLRSKTPRRVTRKLAVGSALIAFSLIAVFALAPPPPPSKAAELAAYITHHGQSMSVSTDASASTITQDKFSSSPDLDQFAANATNYDWAKLVLVLAQLPANDTNVTVFVRWMRQENGPPNWWNRDNPLNNGWGSGGGGGTGSYANLLVAAQMCAQALRKNSGYSAIVAAFTASASDTSIEQAIWASPWSTSHYAGGTHWSHAPVPAVKAPASAW